MPRGAKKNANQHNNRHENGIVAPGRRITKQKSNGHLSGSPDGRSQANTPPLPSPSAQHLPNALDNSTNGSLKVSKPLSNSDSQSEDFEARQKRELVEGVEVPDNGIQYMAQVQEQYHRKIDVNATKNPAVHDNSAMHLAFTILKSCPLRDTLAILMVLLTLPPTFLTLTNTLFALLTFVPPSGSFSTLPSLSEITQGSSGAPSFITICITDVIGILLWLVIFTPVQSLALDLTQAVVATTLGGGYSSRTAGSDSTLLCMSIVSATHLSRYKELIWRVARHTWIGKWIPILEANDNSPVLASNPFTSGWSIARGVRIFIALHILIQGWCRMVRRWYFKREYAQAASISKRSDPEAVGGSQTHAEGSSMADQIYSPGIPSTETNTKTSLQAFKSAQEKFSSGKKKRKQGSYVRSQQPLWAAFAATKVTVIREYEQSQATSEAVGSKATDAKNLGSAPFVSEEGRIWITLVRPASFYFDTSIFRYKAMTECPASKFDLLEESGIDRSKPFYVRINGADWTSTTIQALSASEDHSKHGQQWTGEVYGLSPAYTYQCQFVRCEDDVVIHSAVIATPSSPIIDQASSSQTPPQHQHLRPSSPTSPITTLKASIAAYEASVNDSLTQQRRLRKDSKASVTAIRKDLDTLHERLNRMGTAEKNLQTRQIQQSQHMRQADDAITSISDELDVIASIPEEDLTEWKEKKSAWEDQKSKHSSIRDHLSELKEANHREISSVEAEALSAQQKRERLQHRTTKLGSQYERLQSSTVQGSDGKVRQDAEHFAKRAERHHVEASYKEQFNHLARTIQEYQYRSRQTWQHIQVLETAFEQQQLMASLPSINHSRPITPEGDLPGTLPVSASSTAFRFPAFGSPAADSSYPASLLNTNGHMSSLTSPRLQQDNYRARSTSVLSGNSIYTDFSDQDPAPPMPTRKMVEEMRKHSGSSGSAGGNSPMSPKPLVLGSGGGWRGRGSPAIG